jgi:DNA-binding NarL/FixJ family response regulator
VTPPAEIRRRLVEPALHMLAAAVAHARVIVFGSAREVTVSVVPAIHAAGQDLPYTPPALARAIVNDTRAARPQLTQREIGVLLSWFACESKDMVARKLGISVRTVNTYIDRARIRYASAPTKAAPVARAIQDGLVRLEDL